MKLLVCGGRDWEDTKATTAALDRMLTHSLSVVIHGGARGADDLAGWWARMNSIRPVVVSALWDQLGKSAGFKRNYVMVNILQPDYCIAFPGGKDTQSTIDLCKRNNITVWQPYG